MAMTEVTTKIAMREGVGDKLSGGTARARLRSAIGDFHDYRASHPGL